MDTLRTTSVVALLVGALGVARSAQANDYHLGVDIAQNRIELCDDTTGTVVVLNNGRILLANHSFSLTGGNDRAQVVRANFTATACGVYNPIFFNGFSITFHGLAGNDILTGGFGATFLNGGAGNDDLTVLSPLGVARGGDDDDCVASNVAGGGEDLLGENGKDCLEQQNAAAGAATTFDCGLLVDEHDPAPGTVPAGCENLVAACGCLLF